MLRYIISVKITVSLKVGKVDEAKMPNCNFSGKRKLTPMSPRVSFSLKHSQTSNAQFFVDVKKRM